MSDLPVHRIAPETFAALAEGGGTEAVRKLVAAQQSKHALLIRHVAELASTVAPEQAGRVRHAYDALASIQEQDGDAVDAVLNYPPVAAWARSVIRAMRDRVPGDSQGQGAAPGQLAAVAAAAAIRAGITWSGEIPVFGGMATLPSLGRLVVPAQESGWLRITTCDGAAEVYASGWTSRIPADEPAWLALRSLTARSGDLAVSIVVEDLDPYRSPGAANTGSRLSAAEVARWQEAFAGAWDLLVRHHGQVAAQFALMIRVFTPLSPPEHGQVSSTSRQTFGSIALSAPLNATLLAATIAHEIRHAKLSALLDVVPMTLPDNGVRHYAPWRDDPRPASGLLQGAYAFLGVAEFWREQWHLEEGEEAFLASAEFTRWRSAVELVVQTLSSSGQLTRQGQLFTDGMARTLAAMAADQVPESAQALADGAADRHRAEWISRNGALAVPSTLPAT
jgi:HEXXH motif-containing protein